MKRSSGGIKATDTAIIMTRVEVANWLKVAPRQLERLGVPCLSFGRKTKRYLRADVSAWLERQRTPRGARHAPNE